MILSKWRGLRGGMAAARMRGPVGWFVARHLTAQLRRSLRDALGVRIGAFHRISSVHGHHFRVDTAAGAVSVRVPIFRDHGAQALHATAFLERAGIRYARLLWAGGADEVFPQGLLVHEWVDGVTGTEALRAGTVTERELFLRTGTVLRRLHNEPVSSYGAEFWQAAPPGTRDFAEHEARPRLPRHLRRLRSDPRFRAVVLNDAINIAYGLLSQVRNAGDPVLVHGDLHAGNLLLQDGELVLIDWLNAHGGCWLADFAKTRWIQSAVARDALMQGYGIEGAGDEQRRILEDYLSIRSQLGLIEHHVRFGQWAECRRLIGGLEAEVARCRASGLSSSHPTP